VIPSLRVVKVDAAASICCQSAVACSTTFNTANTSRRTDSSNVQCLKDIGIYRSLNSLRLEIFEVLSEVVLRDTDLGCDAVSFGESLPTYRRFERMWCLHLQVVSILAVLNFLSAKMK
jgi:hypothetical protein